ncbi:putative 4-hydroxyacetophenone monooxygenase protein [Coleophoma crateriformis]|uniref:Putative 4-hydroxyacetophenone monooxygenase protein n=1 Tax=Coleophoma crateriformis TaxID=565419 RepID=A0A3D8RCK1_9HELO|nr:putative 4-hydroxyacetophenone monooxygenase protein [Coleophoma crateriformis]
MTPSTMDDQIDGHSGLSPDTKTRHIVGNAFTSPTPATKGTCSDDSLLGPIALEEFEYPPMSTPYHILNQYHSKPTKLRVACVGAGASGLCVIYKMNKMLVPGSWELMVFEKNSSVGGTWFENTYPGVACDTPASLYSYSWDQKPDWDHYYAYGPEIRVYFEDFADKNDCRKFIQFNTKLVEARWDQERGSWSILVEDQTTKERRSDWCHVLVNAAGFLNNWQWPDIEGLHEFAGPRMHSAKWDWTVEYKDKTVGVIGNGSTGIQLVPALQKDVKHMAVFMRSPTWVAPPFGTSALETDIRKGKKIDKGNSQHKFTEAEKERFKNDPEYYLMFRKRLEAEFNSIIQAFIRDTPLGSAVRESIIQEMEMRLGQGPESEKLKELLIPKWAPGCRRISPGDGYLEALVQPNVQPVFGAIERITAEGLVTESGDLHKFDILVCATGFKPAFRPAFSLYNEKGVSLDEDWGEHVNLYLGLTAPRFPNYFTIAGPGSTWAAGSLLPSIEAGVEYSVKVMKKIQEENIRSIEVRQDALDDLFEHFDEFHKSTVYQDNCRSWYKDGKIKNRIYLWPGGTIHHVKTLKQPRYEDYKIKYRYGNRFAFLGNGEVKANTTADVEGLSTYVRRSDHDWDIE